MKPFAKDVKKEIENGTLIGEEDKGLYKMKGQPK